MLNRRALIVGSGAMAVTPAYAGNTDGFILGAGPAGRCDDSRVGIGVPRFIASRREWFMWYYARDKNFTKGAVPEMGTGRIAMATSTDGIAWKRFDGSGFGGAVLETSADPTDFDSLHVGMTDVCFAQGHYWMWTFGGDRTPARGPKGESSMGFAMRPGLAKSTDGITWTRVRGKGTGGAALDAAPGDAYAAWTNGVHDGRKFVMYYTSANKELYPMRTLYAYSADGVTWDKRGEIAWSDGSRPWDAKGVLNRHVLANPLGKGPRWLMVYVGIHGDPSRAQERAIGAAVSDDGFTWRHLYEDPIFTHGAPGTWDDHGTSGPQLVKVGRELRLYYFGMPAAGNGFDKGIGLAISKDGDLRGFKRYVGA